MSDATNRRGRRNWGVWLALGFLAAVALLSLLAPWLPIHDPFEADPFQRNAVIGTPGFWLGTDN